MVLCDERDIAMRLGVPVSKVRAWQKSAGLPSLTLPGGEVRFDANAVADWLASKPYDADETAAETAADTSQDADFKSEYASNRETFMRQGLSEADYVASRRVDTGLASLSVGSAKR